MFKIAQKTKEQFSVKINSRYYILENISNNNNNLKKISSI